MKFRHMVRIGRHWINPVKVIRVEDLSRPESPAGGDVMSMVMARGEDLTFSGEDAAELRKLLAESEIPHQEGAAIESPAPHPPGPGGPSRKASGHGPGPLARGMDVVEMRRGGQE